ncbi:aminotransferase class V-fold PLP-dependent enzyme [Peribacillus cavernae]|uniref:Aminotransferase class V-fold PLP-dependent enzyme n=1 Tax=Peribacillus cavernae TaxID=1674310 RepID=A0A3S0UBN7_9BACI|nr:IscS subfamily cysteine desulfurase [Peribacillus cavernae]MDQ0219356.1 cysteine desulfurase [Peribacillus cavernae]RUQ27767.1 aminotransferase class V-fold PLP-dependent enzyme [Peribacillus cavernae]
MIYLDYAATAPIDEEALDIFIEASKRFYGNSSSLHDIGSAANRLLDFSRQELASLLDVDKEGVVFTSGGTESNLVALETFLSSRKPGKNHIIASKTEHSSIANYLSKLGQEGYEITYLKHKQDGIVNLIDLLSAIRQSTCMIVVAHANSEIGCIQPLDKIREIIGNREIFLHADCVQSFGKLDLISICSAADSLSISSHKVYGPKGAGAVIFPNIHRLKPPVPGTSHENGFRAGTVNVPAIASFVTACKKVHQNRQAEWEKTKALRTLLIGKLRKKQVSFEVIQSDTEQLPSIIGLIFPGFQGQFLMLELNRAGYAVSTGSACTIGKQEPSKTMKAISKSDEEAKGLIRISLGKDTTEEHIIGLSQTIASIIQ